MCTCISDEIDSIVKEQQQKFRETPVMATELNKTN